MRVTTLCVTLAALMASALALAEDEAEKQCAKRVDASVAAIEMQSKQTGTEQKLKGLSVADIRKMQTEKGSCVAMQEINKRIME